MAGTAFAACTGTVLDEFDEPVIGASVVVKGNASTGSATDIDGYFSISSCKPGDILVVTYIGYRTTEFCVGTTGHLQIGMCSDDALGGGDCGTSSGMGTSCSGGGGGCTTLACTACTTAITEWASTGTAGYEFRLAGGTCSGNSCTSHGTCTGQTTEYRCADGYAGSTTNGKTGCYQVATCTSGCCGTVISSVDNDPLIGASVVGVQSVNTNGYSNGATTNIAGIYQIPCDAGDTLIFTYVGYSRKEIKITSQNRSGITVSLDEDAGEGACNAGYYMDWSTGHSRCIKCPSDNNVAGTIPASNDGNFDNTIYYCKIPRSTVVSDTSGTYEYTSDCYYK